MNERQLSLLNCIIEKLSNGAQLSRGLVSECHYSTKPRDSTQSDMSSEAWINVFWGGIKEISPSELLTALGSRKKTTDLLHKILM